MDALFQAYKKQKFNDVYLILKNEKIRLELFNRCSDKLTYDEAKFLLGEGEKLYEWGVDPKDIAKTIREIQEN